MDQGDRLLLKFDYDPSDKFYKVRAERAFDFLDPASASKRSSESAAALPNALVDEAERNLLVLWRIDDRATVGMVSDLVEADSGVADTADSVLCRSNVDQQTRIAKEANVCMVVKNIEVETVWSRTLSLDARSEGHNHGIRSRLGWRTEWLVSVRYREYRWGVLLLTVLGHVLGRRLLIRCWRANVCWTPSCAAIDILSGVVVNTFVPRDSP